MRERLQQLQAEYEKGQREMAALDRRRQDLRDTLLRIKGAIQILEELIVRGEGNGGPPSPPNHATLEEPARRCG